MQPPAESAADSDVVWRLQKAAYGMGEAAREWYETLSKTLKKHGMVKSKNDPALFFYKKDDVLEGIMAVHVDDFLFGGDADFYKIVKQLKNRVVIRSHVRRNFKFCGLEVTTSGLNEVEVCLAGARKNSINKMNRVMGPKGKKISAFEETMVRSRIGSLQ